MKIRRELASLLPRHIRHVLTIVLGASALFVGACGTTKVTIDSLAKPNAEDAVSYRLESGDPLVAIDSLRHKEASDYVRAALSGRGMYEAPPGVRPDVIIEIEFGVGPPVTKTEMRSEPVYVEVPGEVRTEIRQVIDSSGRPSAEVVTVRDRSARQFDGVREYEVISTVYEKHLRLTARENAEAAEGRPPSEIWAVDVTSEGRSRDLRKTLPVLVAASIDHIGKDSHGQKTIKLQDKDPDVAFVKTGL